MDPLVIIAVLFLVAFAPSIIFTILIARAKRYRREPVIAVFLAFLWGATGAALIALVVNTFALGAFVRPALRGDDALAMVVVAVIVAPLVEETVKPLVLFMGPVKRNCDELVDGLIYGAVAGLGFAATENLLYEAGALLGSWPVLDVQAFITVAIFRTVSATLLHAVLTAIVGYGIAVLLNRRWGSLALPPLFLLAVLIHAGYNAIVSLAPGIVIIPLIVVVIWGFFFVRRRIRKMSLVSPSNHWIMLRQESGPPARPRPPERWRPVPDDHHERPSRQSSQSPPTSSPYVERWSPVPPTGGAKRPKRRDGSGEADENDPPRRR